jgi:hypothetical protein
VLIGFERMFLANKTKCLVNRIDAQAVLLEVCGKEDQGERFWIHLIRSVQNTDIRGTQKRIIQLPIWLEYTLFILAYAFSIADQ